MVMLARGAERLAAAAAEVGPRAVPIATDITDPDSVRRAFAEVATKFGKVHALLQIAGVGRIARIADASDDDISFVMGVNHTLYDAAKHQLV